MVAGEDVTLAGGTAQFDTKDVGTDKDVTGSGFALAGDDKGNYTLESSTLTAEASITARQLTGHFTAADKVYDGNRDATISGRSLTGVVGGEVVTLAGGTALFDTKDVGTDKDVTGSGFSLAGDAKGNYTLGSVAGAKADITPKTITGSFTAADKIYDGNRDAEISDRSLTAAIAGDQVSLAGGSAQFDTKNVGTDKDVTGTGFSLGGDDKGNYTLASVAGTKANITPKTIAGSITAKDKLYDGTVAATITGLTLDRKYRRRRRDAGRRYGDVRRRDRRSEQDRHRYRIRAGRRGQGQLQPGVLDAHHAGEHHVRLGRVPAADQRHRAPDRRRAEQVQARPDDPGEVRDHQRGRGGRQADVKPDVLAIGEPRYLRGERHARHGG